MALPGAATVCLIEPDPSERRRLKSLLLSAFPLVESFHSTESFLARYPTLKEGCLIVEADVPGLSACDLIGRLRDSGSRASVIVIGPRAGILTAVRAIRAGATDYLARPFSDRRLLKAVSAALSSSPLPSPPEGRGSFWMRSK